MSELVSLARTFLERSRAKEPDWLMVWREVAALTHGITDEDPRFSPVMAALEDCDDAFQRGDWPAFHLAAEHVRAAVHRQ